MEPGKFTGIRVRPASRLAAVGRVARWTILLLFCGAAVLTAVGGGEVFSHGGTENLFLVIGAASAVAALTPGLPLQNALLAALTVFGVVFMASLLDVRTGLPFGAVRTEQFRVEHLFWIWPALWVLVLLTARGVAVACLRPWRRAGNYGLRTLSLTMGLAILLELQLESCASSVRHYWEWKPGALAASWYGTPILTLWGWGVVAAVACVLMTPSLIQKSPAPKSTQLFGYYNWLVLQGLFLTEAIRNHLAGVLVLAAVQIVSVSGWLVYLRVGR